MKKDKFLAVYAVLDDRSQNLLGDIRRHIISLGNSGKQTMDVPFHISLGSFNPNRIEEIVGKIKAVASVTPRFTVTYDSISEFKDTVVFASPIVNESLSTLQSGFDEDYAGGYKWHAHTTLFIGDEQTVPLARECAERLFAPFTAEVVAIEVGEFFPTNIIERVYLK